MGALDIFSSIGNVVAQAIGAGGSTDAANAAGERVKQYLASQAIQNAADFGAHGTYLNNQGSSLLNKNASLDTSKMDADEAALAPIRAHYLAQMQGNGLAGKAAVEAAQQAQQLNAQGGVAGIHQDILGSGSAIGQVTDVSQNEMNQAGQAINQLDDQRAAMALRKAVMAAQVSHSNYLKNLDIAGIKFGLNNDQANLNNHAQQAIIDAANQQAQTALTQQIAQAHLGQVGLQGALTGASAFLGNVPNLGVASQQPASFGASTPSYAAPSVTPGTAGTAGYISPTSMLGRAAMAQPKYNVPPAMPNTASMWDRS